MRSTHKHSKKSGYKQEENSNQVAKNKLGQVRNGTEELKAEQLKLNTKLLKELVSNGKKNQSFIFVV